jgi:hypothetical protein
VPPRFYGNCTRSLVQHVIQQPLTQQIARPFLTRPTCAADRHHEVRNLGGHGRYVRINVESEGRDELVQGLGAGYPAFGARLGGEAGKERLCFVALNEAREILGQGDNGRPARKDTAECEWNAVEAASLNKGGVAVGGASTVGPDVIADLLCGCEVHFEERKGLGEREGDGSEIGGRMGVGGEAIAK